MRVLIIALPRFLLAMAAVTLSNCAPAQIERGDQLSGAEIANLLPGATIYGTSARNSSLKYVEHYGDLSSNFGSYWIQTTQSTLLTGRTYQTENISGLWYLSGN